MATGLPLADGAVNGFADWAPNWHAFVVHLPVGLLVTALGVDLVALARRDPSVAAMTACGLQTAGAVALAVAYLTGRSGAPDVFTPGLAQALVTEHWNRALWTLWVVMPVTAGRLAMFWRMGTPTRWAVAGLALAGAIGVGMLALTADLGGRLVYEHGVGVSAPTR